MATTPNTGFSYLAAGQAQKHVTVNETLRMLDALLQLSVVTRGASAPPPAPAEGARYIVGPTASGTWAGQEGRVAAFQDGGWVIYAPREGWLAWIADEDRLFAFDGEGWVAAFGAMQNLAMVGINASADSTNKLAVSAAASLFNHDGAGHQLKLNKAASAQSATILYQSGFSGRAEMGLAGEDVFSFKVSADGASWTTALRLGADGKVGVAGVTAPSTALHVNGAVRVAAYTVSGVPPASASGAGALIHVSNETGGAVLAFSDGTAWRRVTDRAIIA